MKRLKATTVVLVSLLGAVSAQAAGWYGGPIARIQLNSNGHIFVWVNAANNECGSTRIDYVVDNDSAGKNILAALLAWQAQGKSANFYISSCYSTIGIFTDVYDL